MAATLIFYSCDNDKPPDLTDMNDSTSAAMAMPLKAPYHAAFEVGDTGMAKLVSDLWKDREQAVMSHPDFFADTVTCKFLNGEVMRGTRENMLTMHKERLSAVSRLRNEVHNMLPLKSTVRNEDRVIIWGKEWITKNGHTDSVELVEDWRIVNGKVSDIIQYGRKIKP